MHDVAVGVAEHLHLDVARPLEIALEQHAVVAEGARRLSLRADQRASELVGPRDDAHAAPATACRRLDHDWIADPLGLGGKRGRILRIAVIAGHDRHAMRLHQRLRRRFRAHRADGLGRRADEDEPGLGAGLGKIRILRQKAVTGMYRLGAALPRRVDDRRNLEIAVARRRRPDQPRLIRQRNMQCTRIGLGVDRDCRDSHQPRGADDPAGNLAAIGNQDLCEHGAMPFGREAPINAQ